MFSVLLKSTNIYQLKIFTEFGEMSLFFNFHSTNIDCNTRAWTEQYSSPFKFFFFIFLNELILAILLSK